MLTDYFLNFISFLLAAIFNLFPSATIADIPWIGSDLRPILVTISEVWHTFLVTFPYAQVAWDVLLYVVIPFEVLLLLAKLFLGQRLPAHLN